LKGNKEIENRSTKGDAIERKEYSMKNNETRKTIHRHCKVMGKRKKKQSGAEREKERRVYRVQHRNPIKAMVVEVSVAVAKGQKQGKETKIKRQADLRTIPASICPFTGGNTIRAGRREGKQETSRKGERNRGPTMKMQNIERKVESISGLKKA